MASADVFEDVTTSYDGDELIKSPSGAPLVDLHPDDDDFDWEAYISSYTGRTRIDRLLYLAINCPPLRQGCSSAAVELIKSTTTDVTLYNRALYIHNTSSQPGEPLIAKEHRLAGDTAWCERSQKSNQDELEKLDLELRHYQNNLIKESVRMAHRDLGDHLRSMGSLQEALKYYIKTRDHCSTSEHVVEMCISVIEVSLELKDYHAISAYVSKAEGLLDSYNPLAAASSSKMASSSRLGPGVPASKGGSTSGADAIGALFRAGGSAGNVNSATLSSATAQLSQATTAVNREAEVQGKRRVAEIRCKLNVAQGIAFLGLSKYKMAKISLLDVDISTADSFSNMASRADIALYIVLCSLAVLDRRELKATVLDRQNISAVLESDTQSRELLESFFACEYKKTLKMLEKMKNRIVLDLHLSTHYATLVEAITRRALRQFVQPYDSLRIERLAVSMGWTGVEGQEKAVNELINLIQKGEIHGKLDVIDKVYHANKADSRQSLFDGAVEMGQQRTASAKRIVMRINLLQNSLVVRLPNERADGL